jgi:uncharacterized protein involved in outer membrane biogenesis
LSAIAALAIFIVLFSALVHFALSREDYQLVRESITSSTRELTGFDVQIAGPLDLPYAIRPTGVFRNIRLSNPATGDDDPLLVAREIRVTIALLPLLAGKVKVYEVSLSGVDVNLEIDRQGSANWVTGVTDDDGPSRGRSLLHTITLEDINARYHDARTGLQVDGRIERLDLLSPIVSRQVSFELSAEIAGVPIDLEGRFGPKSDILAGNRFPLEIAGEVGDVDLKATIEFGPTPKGDIGTMTLSAQVSAEGKDLGKMGSAFDWALPDTDSFAIAATLSGDRTKLGLSDIEGAAKWSGHDLVVGGRIANVLDWSGLELDAQLDGQNLAGLSHLYGMGWLPETDAYDVAGVVTGTWPALGIRSGVVTLARDGITIDASGHVDDFIDPKAISVDVRTAGTDLAAVPELEWLQPPSTDTFEFTGHFEGSMSEMALRGMSGTFERGDHRIRLAGDVDSVAEFRGIDWKLDASGTDLSELNDLFTMKFLETRHYDMSFRLSGDLDNLSAGDIVVDGSIPGITASLRGSVGKVVDFQDADIEAKMIIDSLAAVDFYHGPDLPDDVQIELDGRMTGSYPNLDLTDMGLRSGDSFVKGRASLNVGERPSIEAAVTSGVLDIRPFIRGWLADSESEEESATGHVFSNEPIDFSYLDSFDGRFRLDSMEFPWTAGHLLVESATVGLQQGSLSIDPLVLFRNGATASGHFRIDRGAETTFDTELSVEGVNLATLMKDLQFANTYQGTLDFSADLDSGGESMSEVMANLNGTLSVFVSEALVPDVSLTLRPYDALFNLLPWLSRTEELSINCAITHLEATDGIVNVDPLYFDAEQMQMLGGGQINLRTESFDLRLAPRPRGTRILAHNIDVLVRGTLAETEFSSAGTSKALATTYGKFAVLGPAGLLVPTSRSKKHPCVGSLQEYRDQQAEAE